LDLGLHIIDGVETLCLAYDEEDTFPQRKCMMIMNCATPCILVLMLSIVLELYVVGVDHDNYLIIKKVQMQTWILVLTLSMVCISLGGSSIFFGI